MGTRNSLDLLTGVIVGVDHHLPCTGSFHCLNQYRNFLAGKYCLPHKVLESDKDKPEFDLHYPWEVLEDKKRIRLSL